MIPRNYRGAGAAIRRRLSRRTPATSAGSANARYAIRTMGAASVAAASTMAAWSSGLRRRVHQATAHGTAMLA